MAGGTDTTGGTDTAGGMDTAGGTGTMGGMGTGTGTVGTWAVTSTVYEGGWPSSVWGHRGQRIKLGFFHGGERLV